MTSAIRAIKAVTIEAAAGEMTSSNAKVIVAHVRHVTCAKAPDVGSAKATHVTSTKATQVASATTTVSSAATAAGLCTRGNKAARKQCACQNHYNSSSHDILRLNGRIVRHRAQHGNRRRRDGPKVRMLIRRFH
jgi:hypothetical protein